MATAGKANNRRLPRRVTQLHAGLVLYGLSMALMVESGLGLNPWDVFHQGVAKSTGISFGWVVILTGIPILLLWIPLRQRPGFGTIANLVVVGLAVDAALAVLPTAHPVALQTAYLATGIVLNGAATGLYIGTRLGPGPRDGLMTGLAARFPRVSLRLIRTAIEVSVLAVGWSLGGRVGLGTVAYALAIGPLAQVFIPLFTVHTATAPPRHPDVPQAVGS
jgi:uncharacterized membrane protein YczE